MTTQKKCEDLTLRELLARCTDELGMKEEPGDPRRVLKPSDVVLAIRLLCSFQHETSVNADYLRWCLERIEKTRPNYRRAAKNPARKRTAKKTKKAR
jgi:hypothetical protein